MWRTVRMYIMSPEENIMLCQTYLLHIFLTLGALTNLISLGNRSQTNLLVSYCVCLQCGEFKCHDAHISDHRFERFFSSSFIRLNEQFVQGNGFVRWFPFTWLSNWPRSTNSKPHTFFLKHIYVSTHFQFERERERERSRSRSILVVICARKTMT